MALGNHRIRFLYKSTKDNKLTNKTQHSRHSYCCHTPYKRQNMDREIPAEVKKQKMLKRLLRLAVTGTAATAALLILSRVLGNDLHENELFIRKVDRGPIEISVSASGKLMPLQEEIIVTPINTRILEVYKNPGDSVDEGDPLLKLELASVETEYRQKLDEREMMKSKLEQARVRLNGTISELEMQRRVKSMQAKQLYTVIKADGT